MTIPVSFTRRRFVASVAATTAALTFPVAGWAQTRKERHAELEMYVKMYRALPDEPFPIPAVDLSKIDPVFLRRFGEYETHEPAGTVVVDTARRGKSVV